MGLRPPSATAGAPDWQPNTFYTANALARYDGLLLRRKTAGQSGTSIDLTNWTVVAAPRDVAVVPPDITADTDDRRGLSSGHTVPAGDFRARPIRLVPGSYSQVIVATFSGTPAGCANAYFALYPLAGGAPIAQSAECSASFNGVAAGQLIPVAMAAAIISEADYLIGLVIGSATTFPTLIGPPAGTTNNALVAGSLLPRLMVAHNATGLTAPPASLVPTSPGATRAYFFRYQ